MNSTIFNWIHFIPLNWIKSLLKKTEVIKAFLSGNHNFSQSVNILGKKVNIHTWNVAVLFCFNLMDKSCVSISSVCECKTMEWRNILMRLCVKESNWIFLSASEGFNYSTNIYENSDLINQFKIIKCWN